MMGMDNLWLLAANASGHVQKETGFASAQSRIAKQSHRLERRVKPRTAWSCHPDGMAHSAQHLDETHA
jgi:hypothetical protein